MLYPVVAGVAALAMAESMAWVRRERAEVERQREFMLLGFPDGHGGEAGQLGEVYGVDGRTPLTREEMPSYRALLGEEYDHLRMCIGHDPATRRALSVSARVVADASGAFAGAALAYTDVTDLMNALQVKDEFVALVSHELRTPLTSIVGYSQLLEDEPDLPDRAQQHLVVIQRNGERLRRLIGDLLETAQRDRGVPLTIEFATADLAAVVHESLDAIASIAAGAGVEVTLAAPESMPADLDAQRIAQVVDNLVSIAVKYSERGGRVQVELRLEGDEVRLDVTDAGIGIDEGRLRQHLPGPPPVGRRVSGGRVRGSAAESVGVRPSPT